MRPLYNAYCKKEYLLSFKKAPYLLQVIKQSISYCICICAPNFLFKKLACYGFLSFYIFFVVISKSPFSVNYISMGAFHLMTQVNTNIILSFLVSNEQNNICVDTKWKAPKVS